eukprot:Amastigsp_a683721_5.p2 type:complete len:117 gc:universal Amastigsp_a683721_5:834-1184(+)
MEYSTCDSAPMTCLIVMSPLRPQTQRRATERRRTSSVSIASTSRAFTFVQTRMQIGTEPTGSGAVRKSSSQETSTTAEWPRPKVRAHPSRSPRAPRRSSGSPSRARSRGMSSVIAT